MPNVDVKKASLEPKLSCEVCKKEIPPSTAQSAEGDDYVFTSAARSAMPSGGAQRLR